MVRVRMLLELIFIRNGLFYLNMLDFDIQFLISQLCIMWHFFLFFFYVYFVYDDIINIYNIEYCTHYLVPIWLPGR